MQAYVKDTYGNDVPVDHTVTDSAKASELQRFIDEVRTWNRKQRRAFVKMAGGFKKHGRR